MKIPFNKLKESTKSVKMSQEGRDRIKDNLFEYIKNNPVSFSSQSRLILYTKLNFLNIKYMKSLVIALVILLTGGTSVFAAENAQPGNILYPVKINVNEQVSSALRTDKTKKAEFEVKRIERRLQEVNDLKLKGDLDEKTKNQVDNLILEHTNKAKSLIEELKTENDKSEDVKDLDTQLREVASKHDDELKDLDIDKSSLQLNEVQENGESSENKGDTEKVENVESGESVESVENVESVESVESVENESKDSKMDSDSGDKESSDSEMGETENE